MTRLEAAFIAGAAALGVLLWAAARWLHPWVEDHVPVPVLIALGCAAAATVAVYWWRWIHDPDLPPD